MTVDNLGELISEAYLGFLEIYTDPELASVATAAFINELLHQDVQPETDTIAA